MISWVAARRLLVYADQGLHAAHDNLRGHVRLKVLLHEVEGHVEHREVLVGREAAHLSLH